MLHKLHQIWYGNGDTAILWLFNDSLCIQYIPYLSSTSTFHKMNINTRCYFRLRLKCNDIIYSRIINNRHKRCFYEI